MPSLKPGCCYIMGGVGAPPCGAPVSRHRELIEPGVFEYRPNPFCEEHQRAVDAARAASGEED